VVLAAWKRFQKVVHRNSVVFCAIQRDPLGVCNNRFNIGSDVLKKDDQWRVTELIQERKNEQREQVSRLKYEHIISISSRSCVLECHFVLVVGNWRSDSINITVRNDFDGIWVYNKIDIATGDYSNRGICTAKYGNNKALLATRVH
jgi:hypothetical protein